MVSQWFMTLLGPKSRDYLEPNESALVDGIEDKRGLLDSLMWIYDRLTLVSLDKNHY